MNPTLAFMTYTTIALVFMLIFSFILDSHKYGVTRETLQWISIIGLIVITMFGWGAVGCAYSLGEKIIKIDGELSISKKSITVDDYQKNKIYYFDNKIDFDYITDTTTFYIKQGYNMYGGIVNSDVYYIVDTIEYCGEIWKNNKK